MAQHWNPRERHLGHERDVPPEVARVQVADVGAVHQHAAGRGLVEALDEGQHGGLARPRGPHEGVGGIYRDGQRQVLEDCHVRAARVGETHALKVDGAPAQSGEWFLSQGGGS